MYNLFEALNAEGTNIDPSVEKDPLVEATTEINKANVVDTAQQTALDLAKQNAQKRVTLQNQIDGIKKIISNLENQLVELNDEINRMPKSMSDEEIMRIGEQLNVPEVATNYLNARSGRLNREFEAKKYDVAKDESKKTRKEDYESTMRSLTTEINKLNDLKRKSSESDKSGIDVEIAGKQKELKVLNDKYSNEFDNSFLDSIKVDETSKPISTETTVENTESIVPKELGWVVNETTLNDNEKKLLKGNVKSALDAIEQVRKSDASSEAQNIVISAIQTGGDKYWTTNVVSKAITDAKESVRNKYETINNEKTNDADTLTGLENRYKSAERKYTSGRSTPKQKEEYKKIMDDLEPKIKSRRKYK